MGHRLHIYCLGIQLATQVNSASYTQHDGKWVPTKGRWQCFVAGKVVVDFMLHQLRTQTVVYPPTDSMTSMFLLPF